jgi:hypothetical protein
MDEIGRASCASPASQDFHTRSTVQRLILALEWGGQGCHWARNTSNLQPRVGGRIHLDAATLNGPTWGIIRKATYLLSFVAYAGQEMRNDHWSLCSWLLRMGVSSRRGGLGHGGPQGVKFRFSAGYGLGDRALGQRELLSQETSRKSTPILS